MCQVLTRPTKTAKPAPANVCKWIVRPSGDLDGRPAVLQINGVNYKLTLGRCQYGNEDDAPVTLYADLVGPGLGQHYRLIAEPDGNSWACDCPDSTYRTGRDPNHVCKHARALRAAFNWLTEREQLEQARREAEASIEAFLAWAPF